MESAPRPRSRRVLRSLIVPTTVTTGAASIAAQPYRGPRFAAPPPPQTFKQF
jgi:hypothetical protein